ncbi:MAG TPA: YcaO-like family protein [Ramlibacter sp.]|jgi:ribosomal protein S12 methylthiotransferase accessory factor|uniref:YcaO-like family protein n=1 Tax=Ramlibacter sp. TaxID=1917967 RepID=UPI002D5DDD60|nr:YcaO-like family protein [Ramlibacter sp.]HZY18321.1 YcaO-like family protein [Ramlibacter sp.]
MSVRARRNVVLNDAMPPAVVASLRDPARLCPAFAGTTCIERGRLTVRTPEADVEVHAPRALLAQVQVLCDGSRTLEEVVRRCGGGSAGEIRAFLDFLLAQGALIDASLLTLRSAAHAFQDSPAGVVAPSRVSNQVCRRFLWNQVGASGKLPAGTRRLRSHPLADLFDGRLSTYTFDDRPVGEAPLLQFLWAIAGVVRTRHERVGHVTPRRTIASAGGMHLLQVFVALQRPVGRHAPGIYRVLYPAEKSVALLPVGQDQRSLPRAFGKPWELSFATGAVFLAADAEAAALRYRNRALQYLFMEAGAALHNAGLAASPLDLGFSTIGGYYEAAVSQLCGLRRELVLGAGIFGPRPTADQVAGGQSAPDLEFRWVDRPSDRYAMPFHLACARVRTPDDDRPLTWGRDADPWIAYRKAAAESVEREGFRQPRHLCSGRLADVPGAIDPGTLVRYSARQHAQPGFPFARFDPASAHCWTVATELLTGAAVHVLAGLVFSRASLEQAGHGGGPLVTHVTSSGCAAGSDREEACWRALLEVIERDAFMRHWLAQQPGVPVQQRAVPAELRSRVQVLEAAGCRVCLQQLPSPWAPVALASAQHGSLHFTTMGTAAAGTLEEALHGALQELESRVYAWVHGHEPTLARPDQVATPDHHFELYGLRRYHRRADAVLFPSPGVAVPPRRRSSRASEAGLAGTHGPSGLGELLQRFATGGLAPLAVDITPAQASIDQGRTSLVVVKALVPGLLPVSFGAGTEPLGLVARSHRAARFPHPFP